ncbi:MAG: hypothetical protein AAFP02_04530, partial [Bacteroidota bacterium]
QGLPYLIRNYAPFAEGQDLMPSSPYNLNSWRAIRRWYRVRKRKTIAVEGDSLVQYVFTARDSGAVFSGEALVLQRAQTLQALSLEVNDAEKIPFYSLRDEREGVIDQLNMSINISLESSGKGLRYRLMTYDLDYRISQERKVHTLASLWFYQPGRLFATPVLPVDPPLEEYEQLAYFLYDPIFWQNQPQIPLSEAEKQQGAALQSVRRFDALQDSSLELLSNRLDYWRPGWKVDTQRVGKKARLEAKYNILEKSSLAYDYDSLYASTHLYLDCHCYPDTVVYQIEAVIDYGQSYLLARDSLAQVFFNNYLGITRFHSNLLRAKLIYRYGDRCPSQAEIMEAYEEVDNARRQDIANYFANINMKKRPRSFKIKVSNIVQSRLAESEGFPEEAKNMRRP